LTAHADDDQRCSANTVAGTYGIQTSGFSHFTAPQAPDFITHFGPIASVGLAEFRRDGTVSTSETANVAGLVFPFTGTGTFTVNPDCTGTLSRVITTPGNPTEMIAFVVVQEGAKMLLMGTSPGGILYTGSLERISGKR